MRKFGFKLYSTDLHKSQNLIKEYAQFACLHEDVFMEFMALEETPAEDWNEIKKQVNGAEVRIHASYIGLDTGNREFERQNKRIVAAAQRAADIFKSETIIVHAGYGHGEKYLEETARQFKLFNDERIVVENLPCFDNNGDLMHGNTAAEIKYIIDVSGCGFCFDFSHAICAALDMNTDVNKQLRELYSLNPKVYHMCDGDITKAKDAHQHFGQGNYPLKHFLTDFTDENAHITMETGRGVERCNVIAKDYEYLKSLLDKVTTPTDIDNQNKNY